MAEKKYLLEKIRTMRKDLQGSGFSYIPTKKKKKKGEEDDEIRTMESELDASISNSKYTTE